MLWRDMARDTYSRRKTLQHYQFTHTTLLLTAKWTNRANRANRQVTQPCEFLRNRCCSIGPVTPILNAGHHCSVALQVAVTGQFHAKKRGDKEAQSITCADPTSNEKPKSHDTGCRLRLRYSDFEFDTRSHISTLTKSQLNLHRAAMKQSELRSHSPDLDMQPCSNRRCVQIPKL
jgi:hypothetical protein